MKFGLQHPIFSFDYSNYNTSQIVDSLKNLVTRAENTGFDSFWVMDHFHQIPFVGKAEEPMLEGWTTLSVLAAITTKDTGFQKSSHNLSLSSLQSFFNK